MKSRTLSKSDIQNINEALQKTYGKKLLNTKDNIRLIEDEQEIITKEGKPLFFKQDNTYIPLLKHLLQDYSFIKKATVDMGAVRFIVGGADVMAPGIVEADNIQKGEIVCVIDVDNKKPLVVGKALMAGQEMVKATNGKGVKNIHYVGDDLWNKY